MSLNCMVPLGAQEDWEDSPPGCRNIRRTDRAHRPGRLGLAGGRPSTPAGTASWGSMDYSALLSTPAALDLLQTHGVDSLRERNATLVNDGAAVVSGALGQEPPAPALIAMVAVDLPSRLALDGVGCRALRARIATDLGAEVAITMARGRAVLRLSAHAYNRATDYRHLAGYLAAL